MSSVENLKYRSELYEECVNKIIVNKLGATVKIKISDEVTQKPEDVTFCCQIKYNN